jgi:translation elongation factor EF-4
MDLSSYTPDRIRNFSVVAHIDHGKSTLSERLLEYSGTLVRRHRVANDDLYLDKLAVEKERGITVKAQTASMFYTHEGIDYLINLIDTPVRVP